MTFEEQALAWVEDRYSVGAITRTTAENYTQAIRLCGDHVGAVGASEVTPQMLTRWLGDMRRRGCSDGTLATRLAAIRSFYRWAIVEQIVDVNPCDRVPTPRPPKHVPRDIDRADAEAVIAWASAHDQRAHVIILLAERMLLRRAEIAGLRVQAVNLRSMELVADGKGRRQRKLPIPTSVQQPLIDWISQLPDGEAWVFPSQRGTGPITAKQLGRIVSAAGAAALPHLKPTTHQYRHTGAVRVLKKTGNVETTRQALGHANLSTTSRYLGADTSGLRDAMEDPDV